ncbi:MAG TPA: WecB/TagA/CpsF family glycosyltransferase [Burkholderiales bacterium]|nr:WecB/TagA/CpsF family glycosyltransferase [Burkholderiales bacterium]
MATGADATKAAVLDVYIDPLSWDSAIGKIIDWAERRESRYVCACNVHSIVTARTDTGLRRVLNDADMATPDGMPIAWSLRRLGFRSQARINGPDLMWHVLERAARAGLSVFFYGSSPETIAQLTSRTIAAFPRLRIAGSFSPPYRALTLDEDAAIVDRINASGASIAFIGLGCPKQERWMAEHRGKIKAVMLGVGAAFDYHAGTLKRAPHWMQRSGLEWAYRLGQEPGRLWRRYLTTNTLFAYYFARQILARTRRL